MQIAAQFGSEHLKKMRQGVDLFNSGHYWECHEALEDIWLEDRGNPVRYVYWAVIQVACCLLHHRDGNLVGAAGMLEKAREKLERWRREGAENSLLERNLRWSAFAGEVFAVGEGTALEDYEALARFRFRDPTDWEYDH